MGSVSFVFSPLISLLVISAGWAVIVPAMALIAESIIDSTFLEPQGEFSESGTSANGASDSSAKLLAQLQLLLRGKELD